MLNHSKNIQCCSICMLNPTNIVTILHSFHWPAAAVINIQPIGTERKQVTPRLLRQTLHCTLLETAKRIKFFVELNFVFSLQRLVAQSLRCHSDSVATGIVTHFFFSAVCSNNLLIYISVISDISLYFSSLPPHFSGYG